MGNFNNNGNTDTFFVKHGSLSQSLRLSYVYLDDVVVEEVPFQNLGELNLGGDTILCKGQELTFNNILPDSTVYVWNQLSNDTTFTIDSSGQYILEAYNGCSYTTDTINVEFVEPKVELGDDKLVCKREQVVLANNNQSTNHPKAEFNWYNQTEQLSMEQQLNVTEEGAYSMQANIGLCVDADTVKVKYEIPNDSKYQVQKIDTTFCDSGLLEASSTAWNNTYLWNTDEKTQTIEVTENGIYEVYAENECTEATSTFNVKIETLEEGLNDYNIFSPNGDFVNDLFTIYEGNSEQYQIQIFNRWGKLIWQTDEPSNHWSADGISDGSYFFQLSFRNCAGETIEKKGTVNVMR